MSKEIEWGIRYGEGEIISICDYCSESEIINFDDGPDFKLAQETLRNYGWVSRKIDEEWYDFCKEQCYYEWIKENK